MWFWICDDLWCEWEHLCHLMSLYVMLLKLSSPTDSPGIRPSIIVFLQGIDVLRWDNMKNLPAVRLIAYLMVAALLPQLWTVHVEFVERSKQAKNCQQKDTRSNKTSATNKQYQRRFDWLNFHATDIWCYGCIDQWRVRNLNNYRREFGSQTSGLWKGAARRDREWERESQRKENQSEEDPSARNVRDVAKQAKHCNGVGLLKQRVAIGKYRKKWWSRTTLGSSAQTLHLLYTLAMLWHVMACYGQKAILHFHPSCIFLLENFPNWNGALSKSVVHEGFFTSCQDWLLAWSMSKLVRNARLGTPAAN